MEERLWVEEYKKELDKKRRKEILDAAIESEGLSPENELRLKLYEARYISAKGDTEVDTFMRGWMNMYFMANNVRGFRRKQRAQKEKKAVLSDMKFALAEQYGEVGEMVLGQELNNMIRLYIHLCQEDRHYGAVLLGFGHLKPKQLTNKIARDIFLNTYLMPMNTGTEEDFRPVARAATMAFCEVFPDDQEALLGRIREGKA